MADVRAKLEAFRRPAWLPVVVDGDGPATASKFSGRPWLADGEHWPVCGHCGQPMQLCVQLDLGALPEALGNRFGSGLLQVFYCTNTEDECEAFHDAWDPMVTKTKLVRVVQPSAGEGAPESAGPVPVSDAFPPRLIVAWEEVDDYPGWEEGSDLGIELSDEEWNELGEEAPRPGDKLAGWPYWVQGVEYPDCLECGEPMALVFQIDSEDHLPWMFGDVGTGHITQCPVHKERVAFGWACC